ncbi:phosphoglycerate mutase-like protein [Leucogyrophana mollusca]|uniref:Phosphoglycerate mutase-like protein n=1 Tax=Leucogyrophana mollusca TaxID=85980 RepID=A0ACB8B6X3_9AGAM|nr:phosphoglycerate mutase-like protein [Leucogyrophana mollusca]
MVNASGLLGVVLLARHGDRLEFFQDPNTYTPTESYITPLGSVQEFQLGTYLRAQYLTPSSPSFIDGISTDLVDVNQLYVRADAGGGGSVILNSVAGLLQGLYPASEQSSITLANGSAIVGPLSGYQYIPVHSVEPTLVPTLNSWTSCPAFDSHVAAFYSSSAFQEKAQEAAPFLESLTPYVGGRSTNFTNMWNMYDFVNVQYVHNQTFYDTIPPAFPQIASYYASFHEDGVFTDESPDGIGNIAARTLLPLAFAALQDISDETNPLLISLIEISYKPFISLFNVMEATLNGSDIFGIVDYAAAVALEVRDDSYGPRVSMMFKNGTSDIFHPVKLFGQQDLLVEELVERLAWSTVNTTQEWCHVCGQTTSVLGCSNYVQ